MVTGKRVLRTFSFQIEKDGQLENASVEVTLEKVRGGYEFSALDKTAKVKTLEMDEGFDAESIVEQLGIQPKEEATTFVNKLAFFFRVSPDKKITLPEIQFSAIHNHKGVSVDMGDLFIFVEKDKSWKLQVYDTVEQKPLTPSFRVHAVRQLEKNVIFKQALQLKFKRQLISLIIAKIVEVIEQVPEGEWAIAQEKEASAPESENVEESIKEKAWQLVRDPALFFKLGKIFYKGFVISKINQPRFIVGEERNKRLIGFLLVGASKLSMTSLIKILGEPGTAKDTMLRMWLDLLPIKMVERSYVTPASLRYSKDMQAADVIYIPDSPELRGETGRHLRFMRADDGGLISEYAMKDAETGEMTTKVVQLPVKAVATTSNAITGDAALESGMWTLKTNSAEELTVRVKKEKLKQRAGKRELCTPEELKIWKEAFKILLTEELPKELPSVPSAEKLFGLLESDRSQSRRDPDKLCDLISLIAWLRRFQKERKEADFVDLYIALQIGLDAITETIAEVDERERKIFHCIQQAEAMDVSCRYVANETGMPYKTCYKYLDRLIEKGFVNMDKLGNKNIYSLMSGKEPKSFLWTGDINWESPEKLIEFIASSVGDFSTSLGEPPMRNFHFFDPITGDKIELAVSKDFIEGTVNSGTNFAKIVHYALSAEKWRSDERSKETVSESEKRQNPLISPAQRNRLVYDKARELAVDRLVSRFHVADALEDRIPRQDVLQILAQLEKEGKIISKGLEWYVIL